MYVHFFLKKQMEDSSEHEAAENQGIFGQLSNMIFSNRSKPFYYNIAGFNLSLDEIKHGLLRNNQKAPNSYVRTMNTTDERLGLLLEFIDPRILFVCLDYPECLEQIDAFEGTDEETLENELNNYVSSILETKINIDLDQNKIEVPKVFQDYAMDFGYSEEQILDFVLQYTETTHDSF